MPTAPPADDRTKLILTWDGPLDLHPIQVEPTEQTGDRFDAIATGHAVKIRSEHGTTASTATCTQMVYRHERRQVWLSGSDAQAVEMTVGSARQLHAREVFFDQKRGLARIDGPGRMLDSRTGDAAISDADLFPGLPDAAAPNAPPGPA